MQRVLVIGPCGAGKSTAAVELGRLLELPVHHLDQLHWREGWVESSREELVAALEPILAGERWLIDGNYGGTMAGRDKFSGGLGKAEIAAAGVSPAGAAPRRS